MISTLLACVLPVLAWGSVDIPSLSLCTEGTENVTMPSPASGKCYCGEAREGYCGIPEVDAWSGAQWEEAMGHCDHTGPGDDDDGSCAYYCLCSAAQIQCCKPGPDLALMGHKVVAKTDDHDDDHEGTTCGEVKAEYKHQGCCGNPSQPFHAPERRLSKAAPRGARDEARLIKSIQRTLGGVKAREGPAAAAKLAAQLKGVLAAVQ